MTVDLAAAIWLIETSLTPILGVYKMSLRRTQDSDSPLGTLIYMSPMPIALKLCLSEAVMGLGSMGV